MVITLSSIGCRSTSSAVRENSGSSSRNSTPWCASDTSPGRMLPVPPPPSPTGVTVWCGARKGRVLISPPPCSIPEMECILVVSIISSKVMSGNIDGTRLASILLPEPGGPMSRILCPPAAAISSARFTSSCPLTCAKSGTKVDDEILFSSAGAAGGIFFLPSRCALSCLMFLTG